MGNLLKEDELELRSLVKRFVADHIPTEVDKIIALSVDRADGLHSSVENQFQALGLVDYIESSDESLSDLLAKTVLCCFELDKSLSPQVFSDNLLYKGFWRNLIHKEGDVSTCVSSANGSYYLPSACHSLALIKQEGKAFLLSGEARFKHGYPLIKIKEKGEPLLLVSSSNLQPAEQPSLRSSQSYDLLEGSKPSTLSSQSFIRTGVNFDTFATIQRFIAASSLLAVSEGAFELCTKYVKERVQFGVPIGAFQTVQHKLATSFSAIESAKALLWLGIRSEFDSTQQHLASHTVLKLAVKNSVKIIEEMIQLHGGIGFTWEFPLHLFLRRANSLSFLSVEFLSDEALLNSARESVVREAGAAVNH